MTDHEAAVLLRSVCGYLGLSPEMLKYRVLSGGILMPPPTVELQQAGVNLLGVNRVTPTREPTAQMMLGETRLRLLTEDR